MSVTSRFIDGMSRRHFMSHVAGAAALAAPATAFTNSILANAADLKRRHKAAILLWMGGGPSTPGGKQGRLWATGQPVRKVGCPAARTGGCRGRLAS